MELQRVESDMTEVTEMHVWWLETCANINYYIYLEICANIRFSVIAFWRWLFVVSEDEQQILSGYTSWIMSLTLLKTLQMLPHNLHYFKLKRSLKPAWFFSSFVGNLFFFFLPRCWQEIPFLWEIKNISQTCVLLIFPGT